MAECCLCGFEHAPIKLNDKDYVCLSCWEGYSLYETEKLEE